MSMMLCRGCDRLVDTDTDLDSLYVMNNDGECWCEGCRDEMGLKTEFDEDDAP